MNVNAYCEISTRLTARMGAALAGVRATALVAILSPLAGGANAEEEALVDSTPTDPVSALAVSKQLVTPTRSNTGEARFTLSPGDSLRLTISGTGGEEFSGDYEINHDATLSVPFLDPVPVGRLTPREVQDALTDVFVQQGFFRPGLFRVSVQLLEYSAIRVSVTGAVFEPGRVVINEAASEGNSTSAQNPGDNPMDRSLTSALLAAGGVTPRADVWNIRVLRPNGDELTVDLSGLFSGAPVDDVPLMSDDIVFVPNSGKVHRDIVRPSPITPTEVATFVSNVTEPTQARNTLETSDRVINTTLFTYGTRLSQAVIAAQCAGGSSAASAPRKVLFIHTNELTGEVDRVETDTEVLMGRQENRSGRPLDEINPYLMPRDGIVCYDSGITNLREIFSTLATILVPFNLYDAITD